MNSRITLLDVGTKIYGDCLLCQFGSKTILIDGAHPGDWKSTGGQESIPEQLSGLLGGDRPHRIDLLVVTHCHLDHIGCLPKLVADGIVEFEWALVADEHLGFGRAKGDVINRTPPDATDKVARIVAAFREEDFSSIKSDAEVQQIISDAASLEADYVGMLETLSNSGTKVVRFGQDDTRRLVEAFSDIGLRILGPSRDHLVLCAEAISQVASRVADLLSANVSVDQANEVDLYRRLAAASAVDGISDGPRPGAPLNNQSVVLLFEVSGQKLLFTGDMQLAAPEVRGLGPEMVKMRTEISKHAPFTFAKIAHHGATNGIDEQTFGELKGTALLAMSGGSSDAGHPSGPVLDLLRHHANEITFVRTDKNGQITLDFSGRNIEISKARGRVNDFTPNGGGDRASSALFPTSTGTILKPETKEVALEPTNRDFVEVVTRIPNQKTRVTITIDIDPGHEGSRPTASPSPGRLPLGYTAESGSAVHRVDGLPKLTIAPGRVLPKLLFVTSKAALRRNIGSAEADHVLSTLHDAGHAVFDSLDLATPALDAVAAVNKIVTADFAGVVIVGGYDVVPAMKLDVLDPERRQKLARPERDSDLFVVWSDAAYGNIQDGKQIPVSRIPDAQSSALVFACLSATAPRPAPGRYGIRNDTRPFADNIFNNLPGQAPLLASKPTVNTALGTLPAEADYYFMLHGSDRDSTKFWGEDNGDYPIALSTDEIPREVSGVVFTGCCWGALTVETPAARTPKGKIPAPRPVKASIALSFLQAGALAFVGCTGTHYSPLEAPYLYFGGPMHQSFWASYMAGAAPAQALFNAKAQYISNLFHGRKDQYEQAIELKILRQYTCLGLGW